MGWRLIGVWLLVTLIGACEGRGWVREVPVSYRFGEAEGDFRAWVNQPDVWTGLDPVRLLPNGASREVSLWLKLDLPQNQVERPALLLPPFRMAAQVHDSNGRPLELHDVPFRALRLGRGMPRIVALLPQEATQATSRGPAPLDQTSAFIRVFSPMGKVGPQGPVWFGSEQSLSAFRLANGMPSLIVGCALATLGLVALLAAFTTRNRRLASSFGAWTLSVALYVLSHSRVYDVLDIDARVSFALWALATALAPPTAVQFLRTLVPELGGLHTLRAAWWGGAVFLASSLANLIYVENRVWPEGAVGLTLFGVLWPVHRALVAWCLGWAVLELSKRVRRGDVSATIVAVGAVPFVVSVGFDIAVALGIAWTAWPSNVHWAALVLIVAAAVALQRRYADASAAREQYTELLALRVRERELLMQDLHDGVGAFSTNVRMLAELGQRQALDGTRSTLNVIGELAEDNMTELRSVITGLDPDLTWGGLVAHVRELARRLIGQRDVRLVFETTVTLEDEHPEAIVTTNLLAMYREAFTNALRHANPGYIAVNLCVAPEHVQLTLENDGGKPEGTASDTTTFDRGRGLRGLRRRATDLGGHFDCTIGAVTRVNVTFPLRGAREQRKH